ncbi:hypothetical protein SISSUDRAFT_705890 [Sistotremastrum suecicum HHB10207 ss-3]|uniref:Methyltransferase n=1 Tax=Sistotremastrum suecicum HHB10207 ss-3 TaxID=1314776 RepID=A0A166DU63_9AGAM|nr:hypothetical protein SISSUDRAFT_705890 [Sistotremastrum suecicum HHB10207 ss-3]
MSVATDFAPRPYDVHAKLNYYEPIGSEPPYQYIMEPPEGTPKHNLGYDVQDSVIHDVRGNEKSFSLEVNGFQWAKHHSQETEFRDDAEIRASYYPEIESLLKKITGAKRVVCFEHRVRRDYEGMNGLETRAPIRRVHIDQTYEASVGRVHHHLGAEADRILKNRVQIINVWRPIGKPVEHAPVAVADWQTVDHSDLVPVKFFISPTREGGVFSVRHNQKHMWYYLAHQTPEEVMFIKCFDSETDGRARLTPHTAFDLDVPPGTPNRESIEVRALVLDAE